ncbi:hypothetical protein ABPG74_007148 [Tetrahymena malaccensis]
MKNTKKEQKIKEKQALKDSQNQVIQTNDDESINKKPEEFKEQSKQIKQSKKRSSKKVQENSSDQDDSLSQDTIQKKQKYAKNKQIKGSFQVENLNWFEKEKNNKKFMKIQRESIPKNLLTDFFSDIKQRKQNSQNIHKWIAKYFETGKIFKDFGFSNDENEFLLFQVKMIQEYLQKRQMSLIEYNQTIKYLDVSKKVDLVCQNDQECIIVQFLVTKRTPELNVIADNSYHYIDLLEAQESMLNYKKKVTVLIVPLLMLNNFRIIEFDREEIALLQKDQEKNIYFQENYIKYLEGYLFLDASMLQEQCELGCIQYKRTVYQYFQDLNQRKNFKERDIYQCFDNAPKRYNPRNRECMGMQYKKEFQQFYLIATLLKSKYKNYFLKQASKLQSKQSQLEDQSLVFNENTYPVYEQELF